jgi:hypothetical protein
MSTSTFPCPFTKECALVDKELSSLKADASQLFIYYRARSAIIILLLSGKGLSS